jgi:molybdopterin/thiamine biosynthesis adenylyltransferase/rhodanese-related sulfurtransferase
MSLSRTEQARYQRHLSLREIGVAGQEKLKAARVLVVGAGGLGSPATLYLAAAGVGTLGVVDCDRVDVSNLQRQILFDSASVSRLKADAARERLAALNPEIRIVAHAIELRAANVRGIVRDYDVVLDGTDRLTTRYLVNDACVLERRPLVSAAIHRFEGQAMTCVPGSGPCYRCLFPDATEGMVPNCAEAGVLGVLPGVMGAIQATEAIKLITGIGTPLVGRLLAYDALDMRTDEFSFQRRTDCAVCGDHPTITELHDEAPACVAGEEIRHLSPSGLQELLGESAKSVLIVDVREPHEFAFSHLPGSLNIPVGQIERRLQEIPSALARTGAVTPVFLCRSGVRSMAACAVAARGGIRSIAHLDGGLLAWQRECDANFDVA